MNTIEMLTITWKYYKVEIDAIVVNEEIKTIIRLYCYITGDKLAHHIADNVEEAIIMGYSMSGYRTMSPAQWEETARHNNAIAKLDEEGP